MISPEKIEAIRKLMTEASVYEEDLEESFILGGGPGGQKTNKTSSVVRLSHEPSGVAVKVGESRSREDNRWLARRMIAETILEREHKRKSAARQKAEKIRRQKRRRTYRSPTRCREIPPIKNHPAAARAYRTFSTRMLHARTSFRLHLPPW